MIGPNIFGSTVSLVLFLVAFSTSAQKTNFDAEVHPSVPDYSLESNWSALPFRIDAPDVLPKKEEWISDSLKDVDVFYVHPTIYQKGPLWNASLDMKKINKRVDKYPVRLQASVFNSVCRVYAPRYRQAVVSVFYEQTEDGNKALDLAYSDVKKAFNYFLEHHSKGRPFIIAGHSQGTLHTRELLKEMIDTTDLRDRLVAAYIIGFTVNNEMYRNLKMCENAFETGCFITYMSYKDGYRPSGEFFMNTESVNPLTWTTDTTEVRIPDYSGTVVLNLKKIRTKPMSVRIADIGGKVLWVDTKAPWFRMAKNLHVADYGLFWKDIRRNVELRVKEFLAR